MNKNMNEEYENWKLEKQREVLDLATRRRTTFEKQFHIPQENIDTENLADYEATSLDDEILKENILLKQEMIKQQENLSSNSNNEPLSDYEIWKLQKQQDQMDLALRRRATFMKPNSDNKKS